MDTEFVWYVKGLTANRRNVLLVFDAYRAYISIEVLELFYENSIIVHSLPAHTSGMMPSLDNFDATIDSFLFMSMLREAYYIAFNRDLI